MNTLIPFKCEISHKFLIKNFNYQYEYKCIYLNRLNFLRSRHIETLYRENSKVEISLVKDLIPDNYCHVIASIYKNFTLKPDVIRQKLDFLNIKFEPKFRRITTDDVMFLEDHTGRICAKTHESCAYKDVNLVAGLIATFYGCVDEHRTFIIYNLNYLALPPLRKSVINIAIPERSILFISGLGFYAETNLNQENEKNRIEIIKSCFLRNQLIDFLMNTKDFLIDTIVICGSVIDVNYDMIKDLDNLSNSYIGSSFEEVDDFLSMLCTSSVIHLMPSTKDPVPLALPQIPFPKSYFSSSIRSGSIYRVTNPHQFKLYPNENFYKNIFCSSGETLQDGMIYSENENPVELLEMYLRSRLFAPTSPETLPVYPFKDYDPFIMTDEDFPDLIVVGGCDYLFTSVSRQLDNDTKVLLLPTFCKTGEIALYNCLSGNVHIKKFTCESI